MTEGGDFPASLYVFNFRVVNAGSHVAACSSCGIRYGRFPTNRRVTV